MLNGSMLSNCFRGSIDFVKGCAGFPWEMRRRTFCFIGRRRGESDDSADPLCGGGCGRKPRSFHRQNWMNKTLFYLMSRGFTKEAAEAMIAGARLEAIAGWEMSGSRGQRTGGKISGGYSMKSYKRRFPSSAKQLHRISGQCGDSPASGGGAEGRAGSFMKNTMPTP